MSEELLNGNQQQEAPEETEQYWVEPSRAEFIWNEEAGTTEEVTETEEGTAPTEEASPVDGVDLSMLDLPAETTTEETTTTEDVSQLPGYEQFNSDFKKFTGLELQSAVAMINELQQFRASQTVDRQKQELATAWGVTGTEFDARLRAVQDRWAKYPDDLKAKLDNTEGAQLIWAKIQQEQAKTKAVPTLDKSSVKTAANSSPKYLFTRAQLSKMSNEEYARNAGKIAYAFQNGLVK